MNKDSDNNRGRADARRLSQSATTFTHPQDVLYSSLSSSEKRVLLAAWASDAHAVPNIPTMRGLDSEATVDDQVLAALRTLDILKNTVAPDRPRRSRETRRFFDPRWLRLLRRRRDDDDDNPPPCPAMALPPSVELEHRRRNVAWEPVAA